MHIKTAALLSYTYDTIFISQFLKSDINYTYPQGQQPRIKNSRWAPGVFCIIYSSVSQPPGRGPVPGPGINYTGPREVLLEFVILVF